MSETNIMYYVNYTSILKKKREWKEFWMVEAKVDPPISSFQETKDWVDICSFPST